MQTFLPYPSFQASAKALDWRRLGKQRLEARQIILTLCGCSNGWTSHPAVKMWEEHQGCLCLYLHAIIQEWTSRGYKNITQTVQPHKDDDLAILHVDFSPKEGIDIACHGLKPPPWLGKRAFHASHRSNLLRKDPVWYGQFGWKETP